MSCEIQTQIPTTGKTLTGNQLKLILFQTGSEKYSRELLSAYQYAYKIGITTIPDIAKANLE
jgi:hypothetical protein